MTNKRMVHLCVPSTNGGHAPPEETRKYAFAIRADLHSVTARNALGFDKQVR
jgi:hypothetical protein